MSVNYEVFHSSWQEKNYSWPCVLPTISSNPLGWFFFWPQIVFPHTCWWGLRWILTGVRCGSEILPGWSLLPSNTLPVNCSHLSLPWHSALSHLFLSSLSYVWVPLPCGNDWTLFHGLDSVSKQLAGTIVGLTSFISCLSGITVLHWQMHNILENAGFTYFFQFFWLSLVGT